MKAIYRSVFRSSQNPFRVMMCKECKIVAADFVQGDLNIWYETDAHSTGALDTDPDIKETVNIRTFMIVHTGHQYHSDCWKHIFTVIVRPNESSRHVIHILEDIT